MPTIPTTYVEKELRKLYLQWISGVSLDSRNIDAKIDSFQRRSLEIIASEGGKVARLGALGDFPAPRRLELSPYAGKTYDMMKQAAVQAGIMAGLSSKSMAQTMFRAGMDKSYRSLERLARTETVSAYWKNAWDSIADLPALVMVWGSEDGPRTCAWCRERDGLVMDSPSLRDHPNGRCTPIPTLRSQVEYRGSIDSSGRIYQDPEWLKRRAAKKAAQKTEDFFYDDLPSTGALPAEQAEALVQYKGLLYDEINAGLRGNRTLGISSQKALDLADKAMEASTIPVDGVVWRGQGYSSLFEQLQMVPTRQSIVAKFPDAPDSVIDMVWEQAKLNPASASFRDYDLDSMVGKTFHNKAFTSTSVRDSNFSSSMFQSMPVQMEIEVPAGTHGVTFGELGSGERELLLERGLKYRILEAAVREINGVEKLYLKVRVSK